MSSFDLSNPSSKISVQAGYLVVDDVRYFAEEGAVVAIAGEHIVVKEGAFFGHYRPDQLTFRKAA